MRGLTRRVVAAVACVGMLTALCACASDDDAQPAPEPNRQTQQQSKIAPSLKEYVRFLLSANGEQRSEEQNAALERALQNDGKVSVSDYEHAWSAFKQCMVDAGYTSPPLERLDDGIYNLPIIDWDVDPQSSQEEQFWDDFNRCQILHVIDIKTVYGLQFGNRTLTSDKDAAIVDCLKRNELVDASFDKDDLNNAIDNPDSGLLDLENPSVKTCLVSNNYTVQADNDLVWHPFG